MELELILTLYHSNYVNKPMQTTLYSPTQLADILHRFNVRPSVQRMAVLGHVADKRTHPTADEIFSSIANNFPSLSRATVYNSLHTLVDSGILRELEIESGVTRYDLALQPSHGHFMCRHCGRIYDISVAQDLLRAMSDKYRVESIDVYIKGICPECTEN